MVTEITTKVGNFIMINKCEFVIIALSNDYRKQILYLKDKVGK